MRNGIHIKLVKGFTLHFHDPFRLSGEKNFHFSLLGFSVGRNGFMVTIFGFSIGLGWREY